MNPSLSVIIPLYNNENYIGDAIESVINQEYEDWELIIVDDYSTDHSAKIAKQYANRFPDKIFLHKHKRNEGVSQATMTGIVNMKSNIFGILDSDDALLPQAVGIMYQAHIDNPTCGLIYSQHMVCDEKLEELWIGCCRVIPKGKTNLNIDGISHFKTIKREYYNLTEGYDYYLRRAIDKDIAYKLEEVSDVLFVDQILYLYRTHNNGALSQTSNKGLALKEHMKVKYRAAERRIVWETTDTVIDDMSIRLPPISIVIPYKPDGGQRDRIFKWMIERYKNVFPEAEICVGRNDDALFNKAKAVNQGVAMATHDILCIADIDALFGRRLIMKSIALLNEYRYVKIKYVPGMMGSLALDRISTNKLINTPTPILKGVDVAVVDRCNAAYFFCLMRKEDYLEMGGYDEEFKGWGAEDVIFFNVCKIYFGPVGELEYKIYHLWHQPALERARYLHCLRNGIKGQHNFDKRNKYIKATTRADVLRLRKTKELKPGKKFEWIAGPF